MIITETTKNIFATHFYDKTIEKWSSDIEKDADGYTKKQEVAMVSTFKGNVRFGVSATIQEQYGIRYDVALSITCLPDTDVSNEDILKYQDRFYKVTDAIVFDSHCLLLCEEWTLTSQYSGYVSA